MLVDNSNWLLRGVHDSRENDLDALFLISLLVEVLVTVII